MSNEDRCIGLEVLEQLPMVGELMMVSQALRRCAIEAKLISKRMEEKCYVCV
ncbi:MAG: hypothetical protein IRZ24_19210 [Thermogemmatispora sp.]|uniref:hypothetical protein n=1 Tax=Thermogemmatispora sp. TaxID=1968838 RepID=UPI001D794150|nr:hypothetical protein [Thermogemmatispora sp.]MBX5452200.1 hypothetical protein [Thermogemmatispora sp.]